MQRLAFVSLLLIALLLTSCDILLQPFQDMAGSAEATLSATEPSKRVSCTPTFDDGLSPSYKPNTPTRSVVGQGHVLTGVVLSSRDCTPIPNAKLEFWPEYENQGHPDVARATFYTDEDGNYRFECDMPEHIHMRISADGYQAIANNSYHPEGKAQGVFDIVLVPAD